MTENLTPPPPPPPPSAPPVEAYSESRSGSRKKAAILGGVAAAVILGGGYGAYAVYDKLDGGGAQPHDVMPASTDAYARLDLDPSAGQKIELFRLIRKFPDLAREIGIKNDDQDIRELVFAEAVTACDDIDYEKDVEPWLGDRVGVGVNMEKKSFTIAVQTKDEKQSRAGIKKLFACGNEDYGIAYLDGYAIVSETQSAVDASIKATEKATLGENPDFVKDFDELGSQGVASAWVNAESLASSPAGAELLGSEAAALKDAGTAAMTLRVDGNALEFATLGGVQSAKNPQTVSLAKLPADTVLGASVAGGGDQVGEGFDAALEGFSDAFELFGGFPTSAAGESSAYSDDPSAGGFDADKFLADFEAETGFNLREDLVTLFGDSLTLALGGKNLETVPNLSGPEDLDSIDLALALTSDKTKALDLVQRLAKLASDAGVSLVAEPTDDGAVLATNQDAADAVADPQGKLGDEKTFKQVIPDGDSTYGGLYVNVGTILEKLLDADPPESIRKEIESLRPLSAIGISASTRDDDRSLFSVRIALD